MSSMENENNEDREEIANSEKEDSADEDDSDSLSYSDCSDISEGEESCFPVTPDLESQFEFIKHIFKQQKKIDGDERAKNILTEKSPQYSQPKQAICESKDLKLHISMIMRNYRLYNLEQIYKAERKAALQNYKNEIELLRDSIKKEIEEKIRKLDEERYKADSEFFSETHYLNKSRKYSYSDEYGVEKRRKVVTISGPYIIHRLKDEEIMEDVNFIKCCLRSQKNNYQLHHSF